MSGSLVSICTLLLLTVVASTSSQQLNRPIIFDQITKLFLNRKVIFYEEEGDKRRLAEVVYVFDKDKSLQMDDCFLYGNDGYVVEKVLSYLPRSLLATEKVSTEDMSKIINECSKLLYERMQQGQNPHSQKDISAFSKVRAVFRQLLIVPGTKWCGAGNVADNYDDLGMAIQTDMCCRIHDHCEDNIRGLETKYGLTNRNVYTVSHCDCNDRFHECLRRSNETAAKMTGRVFFNILQAPCFRLDYPISRCLQTSFPPLPLRSPPCQVYELDTSAPKKWQFFDAKVFL